MDPLTQGALGAAAAMSLASDDLRRALVVGFLAGMAPDLDVLIRSETDPLLFLDYHRHFTHALAFVPVGGLLVGLAVHGLDRLRRRGAHRLRDTVLFATVGWGTHGLLDACTSYGTYLLWPFSEARIAWENISIIDPFVTLPLLVGIAVGAWRTSPRAARIGLALALAWLCVGVVQRERAQDLQARLAADRGHAPTAGTVKPGFANLVVWRSIYLVGDTYFVDGLRPGLGGPGRVYEGSTVARVVPRDLDGVLGDSVAREDIDRFARFSMGWVAWAPRDPTLLADVRYSMVPNGTAPLWGVRVDPERRDAHLAFEEVQTPPDDAERARFADMLRGRGGRVIE